MLNKICENGGPLPPSTILDVDDGIQKLELSRDLLKNNLIGRNSSMLLDTLNFRQGRISYLPTMLEDLDEVENSNVTTNRRNVE